MESCAHPPGLRWITSFYSSNDQADEKADPRDQMSGLPRWLKPANRLVKLFSRLGLPLGTIHVLTVPGRVSGTPHATPVSPLTVNGRRFVIAALPDGGWARNLRAAGRGVLQNGKRTEHVAAVEVTDPSLKREVMRAVPSKVRGGIPFYRRLGVVQQGTPDEFAAAIDRVAVFELIAG